MSYDEDGLDAFRGILARSDWTTYWGIPIDYDRVSTIVRDADITYSFANMLCWSGTRLRRRKALPSWSWTGWIDAIELARKYRPDSSLDDQLAVEFWVELPSGSLVELTELVKGDERKRDTREIPISAYNGRRDSDQDETPINS